MNKIAKADIFKLPNLMSMFRIILIPVFLYAYFTNVKLYIIFSILAISWLTDILDGFVARRFNMITELGKILDPLADKMTQLAILLALCIKNMVPKIIFVIILAKEVIMAIGALFLKKILKTNIIPANKWGKTATGCFYLSAALILFEIPYAVYSIYLTVVLMLLAFVSYSRILLTMMKEQQ